MYLSAPARRIASTISVGGAVAPPDASGRLAAAVNSCSAARVAVDIDDLAQAKHAEQRLRNGEIRKVGESARQQRAADREAEGQALEVINVELAFGRQD